MSDRERQIFNDVFNPAESDLEYFERRKRELAPVAGSRSVCTAANPMPLNAPGLWVHPDAKDDGRNDPYYDHYICPHCKTRFHVEVAE